MQKKYGAGTVFINKGYLLFILFAFLKERIIRLPGEFSKCEVKNAPQVHTQLLKSHLQNE